jgi:hypothetical protein
MQRVRMHQELSTTSMRLPSSMKVSKYLRKRVEGRVGNLRM